MSNLGSLTAIVNQNIKLSMSQLTMLDKKVNTLGQRFEKLGKIGAWGTKYITSSLIALGTSMVNTATWSEGMKSRFNAAFGEMAEATEQWASEKARAVGRSRLDLMDYLAETQNVLVGMGQARDEAGLFSREVVDFGIDLASAYNLSDADAISNLQSALAGAKTNMNSLNDALSENSLALAMQDMGLKGTFKQLDENRKAQVRLKAIVMQSGDVIGHAGKNQGSYANQLKALRGEIKDLSEDFGQHLLPYVTQFVGWLSKLITWFKNLTPEGQKAVLVFGAIAAAIPPIALFFSSLVPVFQALWWVIGFLSLKVLAVLGVLIALGLVIQDVWTYFQGGESVTGKVVDYIREKWSQLKGLFYDSLNLISGKIEEWKNQALQKLDEVLNWFSNFPSRAVEGMKNLGPMLKESFITALQQARDLLPFSPPRDPSSPLRDLHKAGQNIIANIREGMNNADGSPSFPVATTVARAITGSGSYSFSPKIDINIQGGDNARETARVTKAELERMFPRLMDDFFKRAALSG